MVVRLLKRAGISAFGDKREPYNELIGETSSPLRLGHILTTGILQSERLVYLGDIIHPTNIIRRVFLASKGHRPSPAGVGAYACD